MGRAPSRLPHWNLTLDRHVEAARSAPFDWRGHNCCLWAADVVQAISGVDYARGLREVAARGPTAIRRFLLREGGLNALALREIPLQGARAVHPSFAKRGNFVLLRTEDTPSSWALGVCLGGVSAFPGPRGLSFAPTLRGATAFAS